MTEQAYVHSEERVLPSTVVGWVPGKEGAGKQRVPTRIPNTVVLLT